MTELVAVVSTGKGSWGHVSRLIADRDWDNIIIVTNDFGRENFTNEKNAAMIVIDSRKNSLPSLVAEIQERLKDKIKGPEVALNLISGDGKEHMAVLSALLKLGLGIRFVALTKEGVQEV